MRHIWQTYLIVTSANPRWQAFINNFPTSRGRKWKGKKKIEELVLTLLSSTGSNPKGNCLSLWLKLGRADSVKTCVLLSSSCYFYSSKCFYSNPLDSSEAFVSSDFSCSHVWRILFWLDILLCWRERPQQR